MLPTVSIVQTLSAEGLCLDVEEQKNGYYYYPGAPDEEADFSLIPRLMLCMKTGRILGTRAAGGRAAGDQYFRPR